MFIKERPCPHIIFFFMCPLLLPNDGLSNRLKHVIEMYREVTTFLIVPVFSEHKN